MEIKTLVEITFEIPTLPKDSRREGTKEKIRQAIRDGIHVVFLDNERASMVSVKVKEIGEPDFGEDTRSQTSTNRVKVDEDRY